MLAKGFWFHASGLLNSNIIRSPGMTPNFTAHYCELTWFRPWFHLVPHVCTNTKFQLTIVNWFGSGFGSTWFRMLAEAPNLSSLLGIDLVPAPRPGGRKGRAAELIKLLWKGMLGRAATNNVLGIRWLNGPLTEQTFFISAINAENQISTEFLACQSLTG